MKTPLAGSVALFLLAGLAAGATQESPPAAPAAAAPARWAIAIHGGAGAAPANRTEAETRALLDSLAAALALGKQTLAAGGTSLDAVERVVRFLEDDALFNAGKGAVFTHEGTHELDAAIMSGRDLACGAVAALTTVKNPISLARLVMERSRHVFLVGAGAERFAEAMGVERVPPSYFSTERRRRQLEDALQREARGEEEHDTVGAVALDVHGDLAAATSTGGRTNKRFGRVGDVPVIGAGTYADNRTCAISASGRGEEFIRHAVAHEISALIALRGATLAQAAEEVIHRRLRKGDGGVIGAGRDGTLVLVFNTDLMNHGLADSTGRFQVGVGR